MTGKALGFQWNYLWLLQKTSGEDFEIKTDPAPWRSQKGGEESKSERRLGQKSQETNFSVCVDLENGHTQRSSGLPPDSVYESLLLVHGGLFEVPGIVPESPRTFRLHVWTLQSKLRSNQLHFKGLGILPSDPVTGHAYPGLGISVWIFPTTSLYITWKVGVREKLACLLLVLQRKRLPTVMTWCSSLILIQNAFTDF